MSGYLPDGTTQEMLDRAIADDDAYVDEDVPAWIGPHCPVCLDEMAEQDAVRCFTCKSKRRVHKHCAVLVVEDYYCPPHALPAALEALKDAIAERDSFAAQLEGRAA